MNMQTDVLITEKEFFLVKTTKKTGKNRKYGPLCASGV